MQVTSLNGVSYAAVKRTTSRNHQADLVARDRYLSVKSKDAKRRRAADGYRYSLKHWEDSLHMADQLLAQATGKSEKGLQLATQRHALAAGKIANLKTLETNTRAAIGR